MRTLTTDIEITTGYHLTGLPLVEIVTIRTEAEDGWTDADLRAHHVIDVAIVERRSDAVRAAGPDSPLDLSEWEPTVADLSYIAECARMDVDDVQRILG